MIWKTLDYVPHVAFWVALVLVVLSLSGHLNNRRLAKVLDDGRVEFAPSWIGVSAWIFIALRLALGAARELTQDMAHPWSFTAGALLGLVVLGSFFGLPGTIVVTIEGLVQVYWLRRNTCIRWNEIVAIKTGETGGTVTVSGRDGTQIVHSRGIADRPRLLQELKRHCGENLPSDFPSIGSGCV